MKDSTGSQDGAGAGGGGEQMGSIKCLLSRFLFMTSLDKITSDKSWFYIELTSWGSWVS